MGKEKSQINKVKNLRLELENKKQELQNAFNNQNYEVAAKLQYSLIPNLEKKLKLYL